MLSYQHAYHAGNPADVLKHAVWAEVLAALRAKPKPLLAFETHAGRGSYPLEAAETRRGAEYHSGLGAMDMAKIQGAYGEAVRALNPSGTLEIIPGSPAVAAHGLREADDLHVCELHPAELEHLKFWARRKEGVHVHAAEGFGQVSALLKGGQRAAVLIDPSFERLEEYDHLPTAVAAMLKRNPQATIAVWLPILAVGKARGRHQGVLEALKALGVSGSWLGQWRWGETEAAHALVGTAMVVLNLPFKLEQTLPHVLEPLARALEISRKAQTYTLLVPHR